MLIIPVIDLYAGNVVHAHAGQRESYKNIRTPLCHGSNPVVVVKALLSLHPFTTFYIADLNAIKDEGNNYKIIDELSGQHPDICFWLDAGTHIYPASLATTQLRHVIGSETGITQQQLLNKRESSDIILSLDFFDNELIGDQSVLENADAWPDDIIIMSLNRVGTNQGPDISHIKQMQGLAGNKRIYAAGGVRDEQDLGKLHSQDISGVLLATALHQGTVDRLALEKYSSI
jgi:phosphoribosylformimino-5-aminoimidazole carboxamide ribotide isomerase